MSGEEDPPPVLVEVTAQAPPDCPGCGEPGILSAQVPRVITTARGEEQAGSAVAVLCGTCDIDHPEAGPLITYFAVHGAIDTETVELGTALVGAWLSTAGKPA